MKIAILGANSFIGQNLVWDFSESGQFEIFALSHRSNSTLNQLRNRRSIKTILFDFGDPDSYRKFPFWSDVEHVICLVSASKSATFDENPTREIFRNVVPYTHFFEFVQNYFKGHLIFISSGGTVYGPTEQRKPIDEKVSTEPVSAYGMGKVVIEQMLRNAARRSGFDFTIFRLSNPIGRWQELRQEQGILPAITRALIKDTPFTVFGDGQTIRDYFDVQEISQGLLHLFQNRQAWNQTYNFGSGVGRSVIDMIMLMERVSGKKLIIHSLPKRSFDVDYNVLDCTKLLNALGWKPDIRIYQAIESAWLQAINPATLQIER